jgi:hypothetical protein
MDGVTEQSRCRTPYNHCDVFFCQIALGSPLTEDAIRVSNLL